jgi:acyl-CoA reductase-like NAD-dependent aldehyde dehydrogenase
MIVGGERVGARSGERLDVVNPATGDPCATVPLGTEEDADLAVAAAARAFEPWRKTPVKNVGVSLGGHLPLFEL